MVTYNDFAATAADTKKRERFVLDAIAAHKTSEAYKTALSADAYDHQKNETILTYVQKIWTMTGAAVRDFTAANNKITSNFFHRMNTQRCTYSLGNGVTFTENKTKEKLGKDFDTALSVAGYAALIHGVSFCFWADTKLHVFSLTEFAPLWDEDTAALRAGIRFWQLGQDKPMRVVLYEEDGYTRFVVSEKGTMQSIEQKRHYKLRVSSTRADGERVVGGENYSALPIVPLWGSRLRQSTLVGMQCAIDSYDLIRSGFANDLTDCAQIYWIVKNCGGMTEDDLSEFRDRLKLLHIAGVDSENGAEAVPYTQEIPHVARTEYLRQIRAGIYEDFGALDVHTIAAGATNDHIDAAYQPMDENADDFEYQVINCVRGVLGLIGVDDVPSFKRNRISNQREQVEMVMLEAEYLDEATVLNKLPNVTPDEVKRILENKAAEERDRLTGGVDDAEDKGGEAVTVA